MSEKERIAGKREINPGDTLKGKAKADAILKDKFTLPSKPMRPPKMTKPKRIK